MSQSSRQRRLPCDVLTFVRPRDSRFVAEPVDCDSFWLVSRGQARRVNIHVSRKVKSASGSFWNVWLILEHILGDGRESVVQITLKK